MLEFVNSGLYFVQDENNFINLLLQLGSGSDAKSTVSGSGGPKINGSGSSSLPLANKQLRNYVLSSFSSSIKLTPNLKMYLFMI